MSETRAGLRSNMTSSQRLFQFLREKWWLPVLLAATGAILGGISVKLEPPEYASEGRLWVSGKLRIPEGTLYAEEVQNFFGTQIALMKSRTIVEKARERMREEHPELEPANVDLEVSQQPKAAVFELVATSTDENYVQPFLDAVMQSYLAYKAESRSFSSDDTFQALTEQLFKQEKKLAEEQARLHTFQQKNNEVVLKEQGVSFANYLSKLQMQLADYKLERQVIESVMNPAVQGNATLPPGLQELKPEGANDEVVVPGITAVRQTLTPLQQVKFLEMQRAELGRFLRPKHPKIIKLDEMITRQNKLLTFFKEQNAQQLKAARESLDQKIASVEEAIKEWEGKGIESSRLMAEYEQIKTVLARTQSLYDRLLNLLQNVDVNRKLDQEAISVLQPASDPAAVQAGVEMRILIGVLLGLLLSGAAIYFSERLDDRVTSADYFQNLLGGRVVGQIPEMNGRNSAAVTLLEPNDNRHMYVESYRNIRSWLVFMPSTPTRPKTLLVTSAVPEEGKSTVAVNLAQTLAQSGARVLLIDADLRRGALENIFNLPSEPGLIELLRQEVTVDDIIRQTSWSNLFFIPSGNRAGNPGELLLSTPATIFLSQVYSRFDYILVDSAPVLAADDTASLAPKMDGVIFVIREFFTKASLAKEACEQLADRQAKVLGVIYNRVQPRARGYHYYKYSGYGYAAGVRN